MHLTQQRLRGHIGVGPCHLGEPLLILNEGSPTEVTQLYGSSVVGENDIFGLEVPHDDSLGMQVPESLDHLQEVLLYLSELQRTEVLDVLEEVSAGEEFEDEEDVLLVQELSEELDYVFVSNLLVNFYFLLDVSNYIRACVMDVYSLESHFLGGCSVIGVKYLAEGPMADLFFDFEIFEAKHLFSDKLREIHLGCLLSFD